MRGPSSRLIVGTESGKVIAGALVAFDGHRGCICGVWVLRAMQRKGVGTAIVSEAEAWLRQCGASTVHLQMHLTNLAMGGFYNKLGYRFQDMVVLGKALQTDG